MSIVWKEKVHLLTSDFYTFHIRLQKPFYRVFDSTIVVLLIQKFKHCSQKIHI